MAYYKNPEAYEETLTEKQSQFHAGMFLPISLNRLWNNAQDHCRAGLFHKWNYDLDMLWTIMAGDCGEGSEEELRYEKFCKELSAAGDLHPPTTKGFEKVPQEYHTRKAKQYAILLKKHIWLIRLQNKQGKGTKYVDEDFEL